MLTREKKLFILLVMARTYSIIFVFAYFSVCANGQGEINKSNSKSAMRFQSFESCNDNFEIHVNKIIRAQNSRSMGAKYLSEMDVKTRDDCLHLCCVTDTCDVFVFEDKRPGSCYLFHCGSPADFKCKFTKHRNYTSGILTMNHQAGDAQDSDTLSKHEQELNQLRFLEEGALPAELNRSFGETAHLQMNNLQKASGNTFEENKAAEQWAGSGPPEGNTCGRFQFKCRVSGECIAVYNVCNGIPQCADGSDESPNLNCPASVSVTSPLIPISVSSKNQTEQESVAAYNNAYQHAQQPASNEPVSKNIEQGAVQGDPSVNVEHNNIDYQRLNKLGNKDQISENPLKKPDNSNVEPVDYQMPFQQQAPYKKQEVVQNNSASTFSGLQSYLNTPREPDPDKLQKQNYVGSQVVKEPTQLSKPSYMSEFADGKFEAHNKFNYFQDREGVSNHQLQNEDTPVFMNSGQMNHVNPAAQLQMKQHNVEPVQLTKMHLSETIPHEFHNQFPDTKESLQREGLNPSILHNPRMELEEMSLKNSNEEKKLNIETDITRPIMHHNVEPGRMPPYPERSFQEIPSRLYKYQDGGKHIFTHKGYGLVADNDSPEIPSKIGVPNVYYKVNNPESPHNNAQNRVMENPRSQVEYPASQDKIYKILKNTQQSVDGESGYLLPSEYMYEDIQRQVPFDPHTSSKDSQSTLAASTDIRKEMQNHAHMEAEPFVPTLKTPENVSSAAHDTEPTKASKEVIRNHKNHRGFPGHTEVVKHSYVKSHPQQFVDLQQSDVSEPQYDQQQDRPSGALLSVSFGLCITSIMAILVACRLKVVKRRFRRNGKSLYAHDADFLVNGMYL